MTVEFRVPDFLPDVLFAVHTAKQLSRLILSCRKNTEAEEVFINLYVDSSIWSEQVKELGGYKDSHPSLYRLRINPWITLLLHIKELSLLSSKDEEALAKIKSSGLSEDAIKYLQCDTLSSKIQARQAMRQTSTQGVASILSQDIDNAFLFDKS